MNGREMCELDREEFVTRTPGYAGDILYEHLIILQQDHIDIKMDNSSPPPPPVSINKQLILFTFSILSLFTFFSGMPDQPIKCCTLSRIEPTSSTNSSTSTILFRSLSTSPSLVSK